MITFKESAITLSSVKNYVVTRDLTHWLEISMCEILALISRRSGWHHSDCLCMCMYLVCTPVTGQPSGHSLCRRHSRYSVCEVTVLAVSPAFPSRLVCVCVSCFPVSCSHPQNLALHLRDTNNGSKTVKLSPWDTVGHTLSPFKVQMSHIHRSVYANREPIQNSSHQLHTLLS